MAMDWPILSLTTFVPLIGAFAILLIRGTEAGSGNARWVALFTSLVTLLLSVFIWLGFDPTTPAFQFQENVSWIPEIGLRYAMGVDGISLFFVLLATVLTPICVIASWESITTRVKEYMLAFLVLETMMIGMFVSLDIVMFYMFFEGVSDTDVHHHWCLGRWTAHLCGV